MSDYVDLIARLEAAALMSQSENDHALLTSAASAIRELRRICDGMTTLGVDLEDQVAEQLQADIFWDGDGDPNYVGVFDSAEPLRKDLRRLEMAHVARAHRLPDVWLVSFPELNVYRKDHDRWDLVEPPVIREFFSEEEAQEAVTEFEIRENEFSEGYEGL